MKQGLSFIERRRLREDMIAVYKIMRVVDRAGVMKPFHISDVVTPRGHGF